MKRTGPYIGITGFMNLAEVAACDDAFVESAQIAGEHIAKELKFMVGVLLSSKTLVGGTNKWPNRYPVVGHIPEILSMQQATHQLRTIHYNTDDASTVDEQVDQVMNIAPGAIDAIQLNIRWASPVKLRRVRRKYPDLRVILQIGSGALADVEEPDDIFLGEALRSYDGVIDDFLVDPSGGKGDPLDVWKAFACIADDEIPQSMQPGAAGGRHSGNVHELIGLIRRLKRPVNIDAEGKLRTSMGAAGELVRGDGGDHLEVSEARFYLMRGVPVVASGMKRT